jgi:hypothetical protein
VFSPLPQPVATFRRSYRVPACWPPLPRLGPTSSFPPNSAPRCCPMLQATTTLEVGTPRCSSPSSPSCASLVPSRTAQLVPRLGWRRLSRPSCPGYASCCPRSHRVLSGCPVLSSSHRVLPGRPVRHRPSHATHTGL